MLAGLCWPDRVGGPLSVLSADFIPGLILTKQEVAGADMHISGSAWPSEPCPLDETHRLVTMGQQGVQSIAELHSDHHSSQGGPI